MRFKIGAHLLDFLCEIPEKRGPAVGGSVFVESDVVGECGWIGFIHEGADGLKPLGIVARRLSGIWTICTRSEQKYITYHLNHAI